MQVAMQLRTEINRHRWRKCDCPRMRGHDGRATRACHVDGTAQNRRHLLMVKRGVKLAMGHVRSHGGLILDNGECMQPRGGKLAQMIDLLCRGLSLREVGRAMGCPGAHKDTAGKLRKYLDARGLIPPCGCGGKVGHRGWCRYRYQRSETRQRALATLHSKQKAQAKPRT